MSEWKELILGDNITHKKGFAFKSADLKQNEEVPVVRLSNTKGKSIDIKSCDRVSLNIAEKLKDYSLMTEDVIIATVGSWPSNPASVVGKIIIVDSQSSGALLNQNAVIIRAKANLYQKYLYYLLSNKDFKDYIVNTAQGSANQASITLDDIFSYSYNSPPLPEQQAIAEVLSSLDDKIDLLHRNNKTLEQMAESLFRQWFVVEAKEEWEESTFGNFVQPKKGKNITKSEAIDGEYPVVAGGLEPSCYHNAANTKSPVITVSASGANAGFIKLYHTPVWSSDSSFIDETTTPYVYFSYVYLKSNQSQLTDKQEGSAQPHIYPSHIMELDMQMFPETLISHFDAEVKPLFQKIKSNTQQIENLKTLRDTLLPKLMSGLVKVNMN